MSLALALLVVVGSPVSFEAALKAEARERSAYPGEDSTLATTELALDPRARVRLHAADAELQAGYALAALLIDPAGHAQGTLLHTGQLAGEWRVEPDRRWVAAGALTYGQRFFSPLLDPTPTTMPLSPAPVDRVPSRTLLDYLDAGATLGLDWALSHRARLIASAGYSASGGANPASQLAYPLRRGPRLYAELGQRETRIDTLLVRLDLAWNDLTGASLQTSAGLALLSVAWRRRLDRETQLELELGGGVVRGGSSTDPEAGVTGARPVVSAALQHRLAAGLDGNLTLRLVPRMDVFTGVVFEQAEASAELNAPLGSSGLTGSARVFAILGLDGVRQGQGQALGELSVRDRFEPELLFAGGVRAVGLTAGNSGGLPAWQGLAFVSAQWADRSR